MAVTANKDITRKLSPQKTFCTKYFVIYRNCRIFAVKFGTDTPIKQDFLFRF